MVKEQVVDYRTPWHTFRPNWKKQKKSTPEKSTYQEMELPSSKIENFLIFQEMERSCFKIKKFQEMEVSCLIFFLYFRKELSELKKFKKDPLEKNSDSLGNGTFLPQT